MASDAVAAHRRLGYYWSRLPLVSKVCGITGIVLVGWIVWLRVALVRQPVRHVDDGIGQALWTIFLGPTALLFVLAAAVGMRRERVARVIAYCGVLWPVLMEIACFAAFTVY